MSSARTKETERKRELKAEHVKCQNERNKAAKERDAKVVKDIVVITQKVQAAIFEEEHRLEEVRKLIAEQDAKDIEAATPAIHIDVFRRPEIAETRADLPVMREEQGIVEAINEAPGGCVLICGETGSGKTTQIPQFLWECGYGHEEGAVMGRQGMIVVTEPRRVAAVSMAQRVADELNEPFGETVSYQVRYDNNLSSNTKMKFATEGILLREIHGDFLLKNYSVVIVDEAHERSVSGDLLIGMLSRIVPLRASLAAEGTIIEGQKITPLKLVIMSATMRVSDFRDNRVLLPREPPMLNVEARRFPVTNHFAKKTELRNYCDEAFRKVTQIHKKLPPGGILMFLCTQREIDAMCDRLRRHYRKTRIVYDESNFKKHAMLSMAAHKKHGKKPPPAGGEDERQEEKDKYGLLSEQYALDGDSGFGRPSSALEDFGLRDDFHYEDEDEEDDESGAAQPLQEDKLGEEEREDVASSDGAESADSAEAFEAPQEDEEDGAFDSLHVLPLYSLLNFKDQQLVFQDPPPGKRLCVVATNVAETSITIPGIRYVVDCGRVKNKTLDASSGASAFSIEWTSQASSEQRSGRAGRTAPGHSYKLYSTAVYANLMPKHSVPEILRTPIESVVLLMKSLAIEHVSKFPFPTAPRKEDIEVATKHLVVLGAVDQKSLRITPIGESLAHFPVAPKYAKMILTALKIGNPVIVDLVIAMVAVCATTLDVFDHGTVQEALRKEQTGTHRVADQKRLLHAGSDMISFVRALGVFGHRPSFATATRFNIVHKSMTEAQQLRRQLNGATKNMKGREEALFSENTDDGEDDSEKVDDESATPSSSTLTSSKAFDANGDVKLTKDTEVLLRKLIAVGLMDQIARKASVHECRSRGVEFTTGKTTKVPYLDVRSGSVVYIHPSSTVSSTHPAPEYVAYCGLQRSRRVQEGTSVSTKKKIDHTFMKGVTVLAKEWLDAVEYDEDVVIRIYQQQMDV
ncbi:ATP-dependent DEAD/DEAH box RNA helicase, RecQ, putative [Bodo saltans]|uniref:RNA helicase n=1 Tax=Bodo saltans TaxID=75058 RepID=A0A0S4KIZ4_BODSA|nr:ATP-dependent DEAD/DEAH box RNA helicase, RecQ, putative [Bodo saltans]|eukprot:CUI14417.1 ATP-dependent DEAD/DEAH box RNA helicase, RecQ, putative [Bodo saltans]